MYAYNKNAWDYYQAYGLVPGMAQPRGKRNMNENNVYKFNHRKATVPVSMMDAYGIRQNGSFVPGGLANENRRRTERYLQINKSRSQSPSLPEPPPTVPPLPPPSPVSVKFPNTENSNSPKSIMYENANANTNTNTKVYEPVFLPPAAQITRSGRVSRPPSRPNNRRSRSRRSKSKRKSRKAQTRKA